MFGLDCEMCLTDEGPELCRVTLVDHNHTVLMEVYVVMLQPYSTRLKQTDIAAAFRVVKSVKSVTYAILQCMFYMCFTLILHTDELVRPHNDIKDHPTQWSGVSAAQFSCCYNKAMSSTSTPTKARLTALKLIHYRVIDTAILYPYVKSSWKSSLKHLAKVHLSRVMQVQKGPLYGEEHTRKPFLAELTTDAVLLATVMTASTSLLLPQRSRLNSLYRVSQHSPSLESPQCIRSAAMLHYDHITGRCVSAVVKESCEGVTQAAITRAQALTRAQHAATTAAAG
eukprot:17266-Heterococcus_DN1.PRE.1